MKRFFLLGALTLTGLLASVARADETTQSKPKPRLTIKAPDGSTQQKLDEMQDADP